MIFISKKDYECFKATMQQGQSLAFFAAISSLAS
jgi:hypothetical protein